MRIAIDLTWIKPGKTGGGESVTRNLLDGFSSIDNNNNYFLFAAKDNIRTFKHYENNTNFKVIKCRTNANNIKQHLIWLTTSQFRLIKKYKPDIIYYPVYEMPYFKFNKIPCVTGIMDIQAIHYPQYFSKSENFFFRSLWQRAIDNSDVVLTISDFCVKDIKEHFKRVNNIKRIYNAIELNEGQDTFPELATKYDIEDKKYFYTLSSMHKHKNLITIVKTIENTKSDIPKKLVISGVTGPDKQNFINYIKDNNLKNKIILTDYLGNEDRNSLIKHCNTFLFPSLFEGFGMPPVEAMMLGAKVITTKMASIPEVTQNKCLYVNDPLNIEEWDNLMIKAQQLESKRENFECYNKERIAKEYLQLFINTINKKTRKK